MNRCKVRDLEATVSAASLDVTLGYRRCTPFVAISAAPAIVDQAVEEIVSEPLQHVERREIDPERANRAFR